MFKSKIHRATVTHADLHYVGSVTVDEDLLDAAEIAQSNGATVIAITASHSPLAAQSDIHLAADHPEGYDVYSPMVSRLLHLLIIDVLATQVALKMGPDLQEQLPKLRTNLQSKRHSP